MGRKKETVFYHVLLARQQLFPRCIAAAIYGAEQRHPGLFFIINIKGE